MLCQAFGLEPAVLFIPLTHTPSYFLFTLSFAVCVCAPACVCSCNLQNAHTPDYPRGYCSLLTLPSLLRVLCWLINFAQWGFERWVMPKYSRLVELWPLTTDMEPIQEAVSAYGGFSARVVLIMQLVRLLSDNAFLGLGTDNMKQNLSNQILMILYQS